MYQPLQCAGLCGGRRWANEGGSDRDEREVESREDTSGRELRYRQKGPRRTDVQVHRQQAGAQRVPALQPPQSYDQGKTGVTKYCNWIRRTCFCPASTLYWRNAGYQTTLLSPLT